jgi:hypothetical protein
MKWLDKWLYTKVRDMWDNRENYERFESKALKMAISGAQTSMAIDRGRPEGEDRITFELTSAVGGRILNVRRYDQRKDYHDATTYVIPSGEDVGARVAKILNLELLK